MNALTKITVCMLVLSSALAGCSTVPRGEEVEVIYVGSIDASSEGFQMDGYLSTGGGVPDRKTFRNVSVQLYAKNGTLLCGVAVGNLAADHGRRNVSITASAIPEYVLVTSADFWNEQVEVNYFQRRSSGQEYKREEAGSRSELPVSIVDSNRVSCSG